MLVIWWHKEPGHQQPWYWHGNPCASFIGHAVFTKNTKSASACINVDLLGISDNAVCQKYANNSWWRHQMETFSALLAICAANSPVTVEFPAQRPVTRALMFSLICAWINGWVNNGEASDLRRHRAHYDITVMLLYWNLNATVVTHNQFVILVSGKHTRLGFVKKYVIYLPHCNKRSTR